jgi:hypothetical protein
VIAFAIGRLVLAFAIGPLVIDAGADNGSLIGGTRIPARIPFEAVDDCMLMASLIRRARIPFEAAPKGLETEIRGEESRRDLK